MNSEAFPLNRRILIVDDTAAIHADFRKLLGASTETPSELAAAAAAFLGTTPAPAAPEPFELTSAYQGKEALQLVEESVAQSRPFALAFMDIRMPPGWDGIETTARLWAVDPDLQIVLCTAYSDYSWEEIADRLGNSDRLLILKKPFDRMEVLQLAKTLSEKWRLAGQWKRRMESLDRLVDQRTRELRLANQQLTAEVAERERAEVRLSGFSALGQRLSAVKTAKEAARIIVEVADQLLGWDAALCELYSPVDQTLRMVLAMDCIEGKRTEWTPTSGDHRPGPLAQRALREGGQLLLRNENAEVKPEACPFGDTTRASASLLFVPIREGRSVIGLLSIQSYAARAYNPQSLETLQALADHCGGALERIRAQEAREQLQEQLRQSQRLEAIGQLAGGVAHDFNNLLAVIRGNVELVSMDDQNLRAEQRDCLSQVVTAADRAANLTRQLLAFSRKQVMQSQPLNLNEVVANLTKMLKRIIGEDINLECRYATQPPRAMADIGMLEQVLINLVVNARDAMPKGGHLLLSTASSRFSQAHDSAHPEARAGEFVCLTVQDTGTGIAPEHLARIFEPFFTTKELGKGTGLGLATVYGIVQQHQGWIEVSSQIGLGSTFQVFLPALNSAVPDAPTPAKEPAPRGGSETILLVEDDEAVRSLTRRVLDSCGYHVCEASSGREALERWSEAGAKIDLLLTDMIMPEGLTGRDLAEQLLAQRPDLKVIFMSGYSGDAVQKDPGFLERTHSRFLQKPCSARTLLQAVRQRLDENQAPGPAVLQKREPAVPTS